MFALTVVRQPVDDDKYIYIDLDFDSVEQAAAFQEFLERNGLGRQRCLAKARVLTDVDTAS